MKNTRKNLVSLQNKKTRNRGRKQLSKKRGGDVWTHEEAQINSSSNDYFRKMTDFLSTNFNAATAFRACALSYLVYMAPATPVPTSSKGKLINSLLEITTHEFNENNLRKGLNLVGCDYIASYARTPNAKDGDIIICKEHKENHKIFVTFKGTIGAYDIATDTELLETPLRYTNIFTEDNKCNKYKTKETCTENLNCKFTSNYIEKDVCYDETQYVPSWIYGLSKLSSSQPDPDENIKVHSGFINSYNAFRHFILTTLAANINENTSGIVFTGHSMGGAHAILGSLDLALILNNFGDTHQFNLNLSQTKKNELKSKIYVYTFGAPAVGNEAFAKFYRKFLTNGWRFIDKQDVVERLDNMFYTHVLTAFLIGETNSLKQTSDSLISTNVSFGDHYSQTYLEKIKEGIYDLVQYNFQSYPIGV